MLIPRSNREVCRTPENSGDTFDLVNSGRTSQEPAFVDDRLDMVSTTGRGVTRSTAAAASPFELAIVVLANSFELFFFLFIILRY
jgi:hypothetical protein